MKWKRSKKPTSSECSQKRGSEGDKGNSHRVTHKEEKPHPDDKSGVYDNDPDSEDIDMDDDDDDIDCESRNDDVNHISLPHPAHAQTDIRSANLTDSNFQMQQFGLIQARM